MQLNYITRVSIPSDAAQSVQILSMSRAFHAILNDGYSLLSTVGEEGARYEQLFRWDRVAKHKHRWRQYITLCLETSRRVRGSPNTVIFTRDIAVAEAVVLSGGKAVYEAHKQPIGMIATLITRWLAVSPRFKVVAISQALANYYMCRFDIPAIRIIVAHDGVFPEDYEKIGSGSKTELRQMLGLPDDKLLVIHTGSLYKGGAELFGHIAGISSQDTLVVQVGGTAQEQAHWEDHYRRLGLGNILFFPHQPPEKVRHFQKSADLLLYVNTRTSPIHWCTSPLKLFEYMATGVPIIGARLGSVAEVLHESNAFCFDPESPQSIQSAFTLAVSNPAEAMRRAKLALFEAKEKYSWHQRAKRIIDFIES